MNPVAWGYKGSDYFIIIDLKLLGGVEPYETSDGQKYYTMTIPMGEVDKPLEVDAIEGDYKPTSALGEAFLVGYIRKSNEGGILRLSLNQSALLDIKRAVGEEVLALNVVRGSLSRVIRGERAVTTIFFRGYTVVDIKEEKTFINWMGVNPIDTKA